MTKSIELFNEKNVLHYIRPAMVVVRRPFVPEGIRYRILQDIIVSGKTPFVAKYKEELVKKANEEKRKYRPFFDKGVMFSYPRNIDINESKLDFDSNLQGFFVVSKSIPMKIVSDATGSLTLMPDISFADGDVNKGASDFKVEDVESISINRQVYGISSATVIIKNAYGKYSITDQDYTSGGISSVRLIGETIFLANDEISIYLPDLNNSLKLVFRGLVTEVNQINQAGFQKIILECEDFLKWLRLNRINAYPSLDKNESQAVPTVFTPVWQTKLPHEILPYILCRALTNFRVRLTEDTEDLVESYVLAYDDGAYAYAENVLYNLLMNHYIKYVGKNALGQDEELNFTQATDAIKEGKTLRVEGYYNGKNEEDSQLAFVIAGTNQPFYNLQMKSDWNFFISEWKTLQEVVEEMCMTLHFVYYTSNSGVVVLKPPDITLEKLNNIQGLRGDTNKGSFYLKDERVVSYSKVLDDKEVFNYMVVNGKFQWFPDQPIGLYAVVALQDSIDRYRVRMMKNQTFVGLNDSLACLAFGRALLERQNRREMSLSIDVIGDADLEVDKSVYLENANTVYYIERIVYSYVVGQSFKTSLVGVWGRKPLFRLTKSELLFKKERGDLNTFVNNQLSSLLADKIIDEGKYSKFYYLANSESSNKNEFINALWFNDYVWEDTSSLVFEDIYNAIKPFVINSDSKLWQNILAEWTRMSQLKEDTVKYREIETKFNTLCTTYWNEVAKKLGLVNVAYILPSKDIIKKMLSGVEVKPKP